MFSDNHAEWEKVKKRVQEELAQADKILTEYKATHAPTLSETQQLEITISARRWFGDSAGNPYHSVKVWIDGVEIGKTQYTYGGNEMYLQTAFDILQKAGIFPKTGRRVNGFDVDYSEFLTAKINKTHDFFINVQDVKNKRQLYF